VVRNGRDWSAEFVAITSAMRALPFSRVMLDGEAVAHCLDGLPDFHRLLSGDGQANACLYAFDLIWLEAQDLRGVELIGRRRMLSRRRGNAPPRLRDGPRRHRLEAGRVPLQVGIVHRLGEGQEPGI
jgi:bifunctional non-homologous end joining protein LigD